MTVRVDEDAWSRESSRITLIQDACIGQWVLLAIPTEVLGGLQAPNPVLVVAEALAAWHQLDG